MLASMPNAFPQDSSDQSARPERHCAQRTQAVCCRGAGGKCALPGAGGTPAGVYKAHGFGRRSVEDSYAGS